MRPILFVVLSAVVVSWGALAAPPDGGRAARTLSEVKLLYFHASWCQSCKRLEAAQVLEHLHEHLPALAIEEVDVDTQKAQIDRYGVEFTPTLVLVDADGFPLGRPSIDLDAPGATLARIEKLVHKATRP